MDYTHFSFPLNVYAQALCLEEGHFSYLHYGFNLQQGIHQAQQNSTDFMMTKLPPAPADILEVGIGAGTTGSQLVKAGYNYTGVVPDPVQIAYCREKELHLIESRFESLSEETQYDVILFQESAQYISSKALLQKANALLKPTGRVLILDEITTEAIGGLEKFVKQFDFQIVDKQDFTKEAAPSLGYLIEIIYKHRISLLQDLQLSSLQLSEWLYRLEIRNKAYQDKTFSYMFFQLSRNQV
jgi:SAM-dependent methyltransferase